MNLDFLKNYKTYILCAIAFLTGSAELVGIDVVPDVDRTNALSWMWSGAIGATIRAALGWR